jgi:hypothetical protein
MVNVADLHYNNTKYGMASDQNAKAIDTISANNTLRFSLARHQPAYSRNHHFSIAFNP